MYPTGSGLPPRYGPLSFRPPTRREDPSAPIPILTRNFFPEQRRPRLAELVDWSDSRAAPAIGSGRWFRRPMPHELVGVEGGLSAGPMPQDGRGWLGRANEWAVPPTLKDGERDGWVFEGGSLAGGRTWVARSTSGGDTRPPQRPVAPAPGAGDMIIDPSLGIGVKGDAAGGEAPTEPDDEDGEGDTSTVSSTGAVYGFVPAPYLPEEESQDEAAAGDAVTAPGVACAAGATRSYKAGTTCEGPGGTPEVGGAAAAVSGPPGVSGWVIVAASEGDGYRARLAATGFRMGHRIRGAARTAGAPARRRSGGTVEGGAAEGAGLTRVAAMPPTGRAAATPRGRAGEAVLPLSEAALLVLAGHPRAVSVPPGGAGEAVTPLSEAVLAVVVGHPRGTFMPPTGRAAATPAGLAGRVAPSLSEADLTVGATADIVCGTWPEVAHGRGRFLGDRVRYA